MQVLFDQDGSIDDLISLMMLLAMPDVQLKGVVVTPADCYLEPSMSATRKILRFFGRHDVAVSSGRLHGVHAFPREWRKASYAVDALPILNESDGDLVIPEEDPGHQFLIRALREASEPVTILVTGPVSNIVEALTTEPDLCENIAEVVWMGGALHVGGNVQDYGHDGSAEWNAYWDPPATSCFLNLGLPITLFPLDVTNKVPVSMSFLRRLARQRRFPLSDLAGQCWAMTVGTIPAYEHIYFMWDALSAGYLGAREMIEARAARCAAISDGASAGQVREVNDGGQIIRVAESVDVERFHDYVLEIFRR